MSIAEAIRKHGFRRWYERQLVESHAYLVACFLCLIAFASSLELLEYRKSALHLLALIAIATGTGGFCLYAWRRFSTVLFRAEHLAERATCAQCAAYGRFEVLGSGVDSEGYAGTYLNVQCRKCGRQWTIR